MESSAALKWFNFCYGPLAQHFTRPAFLDIDEMKFYTQTSTELAGWRVSGYAAPWTGRVVVDLELVIGGKPVSALEVASAWMNG